MSSLVVIMMDSEPLAGAVARTLAAATGEDLEIVHMTYSNSRMSRELLLRTDLFILDLFRRDALGQRAEGIYVAEKFAAASRRSLLIANCTVSSRLHCPFYWDVAAPDHLPDRVLRLLRQDAPLPDAFAPLRENFASFCRPAHNGHHK